VRTLKQLRLVAEQARDRKVAVDSAFCLGLRRYGVREDE
jgi:hypothetical protein